MATSRSQSRGRSRTRSQTPTSVKQAPPPEPARSRSPHRSPSPRSRSRSRSRSASRSPVTTRESRNGPTKGRTYSRSRSRSPDREPRRSYRDRSRSRSPSRGRNLQSSKIVVEKLTRNVNEGHLREIFGSYGRIETIDLPMNKQCKQHPTDRSALLTSTVMTNRGTAYILYDHPSGSESAIAHMHEAQLDGSTITVSIVLPRRAFSRSPPPARNNRGPPGRFAGQRGPPPGRFRSPAPRRGGPGPRRDTDDYYAPRSRYSRSLSPPPPRRRSISYSRSPSRSPPRRRGPPARSPPRRRRRSPSYSSYSSRSRSRSPSRSRNNGRR